MRDWTIGTIEAGDRSRGATPEGRLLAIFDVFDDRFHRDDFEACPFVKVMREMGTTHPLGRASIEHLKHIRGMVATLAEEAGLREPTEFGRSWHMLMKGSMVSATEGDSRAARRAQNMGRALIREHFGSRDGSPRGTGVDETVAAWSEGDEFSDLPGERIYPSPISTENAFFDFDFDYDYDYEY